MKTWRVPRISQADREAVAAILALPPPVLPGEPWESVGGHHPMGVIDEPVVVTETATKRIKIRAGQGTLI